MRVTSRSDEDLVSEDEDGRGFLPGSGRVEVPLVERNLH